MSKFTKQLDTFFKANSLTAILASDTEEPKKEETPEVPAEAPKQPSMARLSLLSA